MDNLSHIEIDGGQITAPTLITDAKGTRSVPTLIGSYRFFVDVVEADGCRISMWDGESYAEAIKEAESLRTSFGAKKIVDLTGRGAA